MSQSNGQFRGLQFLGFGGLAALIGLVLVVGRYQSSIDAALNQQAKTQQQITDLTKSVVTLTEAVHMNQYRITKLEERK